MNYFMKACCNDGLIPIFERINGEIILSELLNTNGDNVLPDLKWFVETNFDIVVKG